VANQPYSTCLGNYQGLTGSGAALIGPHDGYSLIVQYATAYCNSADEITSLASLELIYEFGVDLGYNCVGTWDLNLFGVALEGFPAYQNTQYAQPLLWRVGDFTSDELLFPLLPVLPQWRDLTSKIVILWPEE
jgi:hypothetical protein